MNRKTLVTLALALITALPLSGVANEVLLGYLYEAGLDKADQNQAKTIGKEIQNENFDAALNASKTLIKKHESATTPLYNSDTLARLYVNHGIIGFLTGTEAGAYDSILKGLSLFEQAAKPFDKALVPALMAKGIIESKSENWEEAEASIRRAQHIMHRHSGVYAEEQLESISYLSYISMALGRPDASDKQQLFSLRVAEQAYGENSEELLPYLATIAHYFSIRSDNLPAISTSSELTNLRNRLFRYSVEFYKQSIDIVEKKYGEHDLRLLSPLRGLANARILNGKSRARAEKLLLRAKQIVDDNPSSDNLERVLAIVDLADLYTIMGLTRQASPLYLDAWELLQKDSDSLEIGNLLFNAPVRISRAREEVITLRRTPTAAQNGEQLYASLQFRVDERGQVRNIEVIGKNIPNEPLRVLRQQTREASYRPRIENGVILATDGLEIYQRYQAPRQSSTPAATTSPTTDDLGDKPDKDEGDLSSR